MKKILTVTLLFLVYAEISAQSPGQLLYSPHSPAGIAAGGTGVSNDFGDPLAYYYNPAKLGIFNEKQTVDVYLTISDNESGSVNDFGFKFNYDLSGFTGLPLKGGIAYLRTWNEDESVIFWDRYKIDNLANVFSAGIGLDLPVKISTGISFKTNNHDLEEPVDLDESKTSFLDWGVLFKIPVANLVIPEKKFLLANNNYLKPLFDISLGYSLQNYGEEFEEKKTSSGSGYMDDLIYDPREIPIMRRAMLGYTLDFGLNIEKENTLLELAAFSFSAESIDGLMHREGDEWEYESFTGQFQPWNDLVLQRGRNGVSIRTGRRFGLLETFSYYSGRMFSSSGVIQETIKSNGWEISTKGLFKFLVNWNNPPKDLKWILGHIDITYYHVNIVDELIVDIDIPGIIITPVQEEKPILEGINITFKNIF